MNKRSLEKQNVNSKAGARPPEGGGQACAAPPPLGADSPLPCLIVTSVDTEANRLNGGHARTAFALGQNVQAVADWGEAEGLPVRFHTYTFAGAGARQEWEEAKPIFRRLMRRILSDTKENGRLRRGRYRAGVLVIERGDKSGQLHAHAVCVGGPKDIRQEWDFWRGEAQAECAGLGRCRVEEIRSNSECIGRYVGKYIAKHIKGRTEADKGARLVRIWGNQRKDKPHLPAWRRAWSRVGWHSVSASVYRRGVGLIADYLGTDDLAKKCGKRWAMKLGGVVWEIGAAAHLGRIDSAGDLGPWSRRIWQCVQEARIEADMETSDQRERSQSRRSTSQGANGIIGGDPPKVGRQPFMPDCSLDGDTPKDPF